MKIVEKSIGIPDRDELREKGPRKEKNEVSTCEPKRIEMERDERSRDDHQMENMSESIHYREMSVSQ